jgi:DNA-binding winged helix-turn-helix (wHTH) protein/AraC-like DNA-binding protein
MADADVHRNLQFGPFEISSRERVLWRDGVVLPLGSKALDILIYLAERPGEVIAKQELIDHVWSDVKVEEGSLRVHVAAIRKALGDGRFGNRYIANIKGRGYSFVGTVVPLAGSAESRNEKFERPGRLPARSRRMIGRDAVRSEARDRKFQGLACWTTIASATRRTRIMTTGADQFDDTPLATDVQQFVYMAHRLVELLEIAGHELKGNHEAAKASLAKASNILQSETARRSGANGSKAGGLAGWQILQVQAFIDENLHRTIHIRDLSAVARVSPPHFWRSFKRAFGEPPHAYVMRKRLERAYHLMITSSASLSEIALSVGFSDQTHLSRLFKRAFNQSPSSWRRDLKSRRG